MVLPDIPDSTPVALTGTEPLLWDFSPDELSYKMMEGAHRFIDQKIKESVPERTKFWNRDFSSAEAYKTSIEPNRQHFMKYIGVVDKSIPLTNYNKGLPDVYPPVGMEIISRPGADDLVAETADYKVYQVRWPVLNGVNGEGLLIQPKNKTVANIIAIPDAGQTPEQLMGLEPGIDPHSQFARRLAENGFQVLIPVLIDRTPITISSQNQQTHREWIYRQAFHMGRHPIGYEVQKIMSAIDWLEETSNQVKTGVAGYGEGGLLAMYTAAIDDRIDATMVSGYFQSRQEVWNEPIDRNVWGLLSEFGDAEIVSMIAPRPVVIEYSKVPKLPDDFPIPFDPLDKAEYTGYKGRITTPDNKSVKSEYERIDNLVKKGFQPRRLIQADHQQPLAFGSEEALSKFVHHLGFNEALPISKNTPSDQRESFDATARQFRQVKELENHVQGLMHTSPQRRNDFFLNKAMPDFNNRKWNTESFQPYYEPQGFVDQGKWYRDYFAEEVIGRFEDELLPPSARTKKIYDKERWDGYEVVLDVYDGFISPGVLLVPKNIQHDEKRPVVVIQHGRNGVPEIVIEGSTSYYDIGAKLADQGFIVYIPYGLFKGEDQYRFLDRKANTVKKTLFSFILAQHTQILNWLNSLPFVDGARIGFYGKSYGGETAMRIPAILEGYALSICSGDFGDWTRKVVDVHYPNSFVNTNEWEMPYFNMGNTFSYAEMAYLIFPRPFMVERGHHDLVQPDEWVFSEYGKVKFLYDQFNLEDRIDMEVFNGGHASRNVGTFRFLRKQLNWP